MATMGPMFNHHKRVIAALRDELRAEVERLKKIDHAWRHWNEYEDEIDALKAEVKRLRLAERLADAVLAYEDYEGADRDITLYEAEIEAYRAAKERDE